MNTLMTIFDETMTVAGQMSPYLLFGFLAAGTLHVFVSPAWMRRHLGGRGMLPVVKSVLMGVPLPLCSCGVIAVTASMRKQGAGRGAATGFLLATPQTGVDSIAATWGMMGPALGVFRPVMALITGMVGGGLAALFDREDDAPATGNSCGDGCEDEERPERSVREVLRYGLVTLPRDIAKPLIVGVIIAGAIAALAPRDMLAPYIGGGVFAMMGMTVVGIPLYVCATASIPVALSFMHLGASPGAALAFLIAGPATNAATIATVWKVMGKTTAAIYLGTVFVGAVASGLLFDGISGSFGEALVHDMAHEHEHEAGGVWTPVFWAALLAAVVLHSLYGDRLNRLWKKEAVDKASEKNDGRRIELYVTGMTCSHCAVAVARALRGVEGVEHAEVELTSGKATITGDKLPVDALLATVKDLGYKAERVQA
ncbi:MAG TPA: permease [Candidatus Hydrogenedentes bacterium]|nr:permease [Candidatus Hydrogenedentota bacterium]